MATNEGTIKEMQDFCTGYAEVHAQLREIVKKLDDLTPKYNMVKLHMGQQKRQMVNIGRG